MSVSNVFYTKNGVTLYHGDRLDLLDKVKQFGEKAKLVFTSPPYNLGKEYETAVSLDEYLSDQRETIKACLDILHEDGSICWQVGNYISGKKNNKEVYPLDIVLYPIFKSYGLKLKNRIVWHFGHGLHETVRFSGRHETILWFVKSDSYTFNLDPVRVPQKYPGKRHYKGDRKGELSGNPLGKNPSDIWDIPNVKNNHPEKTIHPCQFPVGLVERFVLATTNEGDLVVDPYIGVGSTAVASIMHNRRVAGSDTELKYLDIAKDRINSFYTGNLSVRDLNKPVFEPQGKLSEIPDEWK